MNTKNQWINTDSIKKDEIPLLTPLYIKTKNYGIYVGFLETYPSEYNFDYIDEEGNEFIYKWNVPELPLIFSFNEVEAYSLIPPFNNINQEVNWVSVDEALPEIEGYYLVFCPYWENKVCSVEFNLDLGDFLKFSDEITHWKPLPLLPNQ